MNIYNINKKEIEDMEIKETGYKVLHYDLISRYGGFSYGNINENIVGNVYKMDNNVGLDGEELWYGEKLWCCKNPEDLLEFYGFLAHHRYFKVNCYGEISNDGKKTISTIIEFVEEYKMRDFLRIIASSSATYDDTLSSGIKYSEGINVSNGVTCSRGISLSKCIDNSGGVSESESIAFSKGVCDSTGVRCGDGISKSYGISCSMGIYETVGAYSSDGVCASNIINDSCGINTSYGVNKSNGINKSYGVNWSYGVNNSYGLSGCESVSKCIFCCDVECVKYYIFNKKVSKAKFNEIYEKLKGFEFIPDYTNIFDLSNGEDWTHTNLELVSENTIKQAWSKMPKEMLEYIVSLKEFDADIFYEITGIDVETKGY